MRRVITHWIAGYLNFTKSVCSRVLPFHAYTYDFFGNKVSNETEDPDYVKKKKKKTLIIFCIQNGFLKTDFFFVLLRRRAEQIHALI